jgi:flagellar biosynthetic protein FlhB
MAEDQDQDSSQKTEQPTQRRIEEAVKRGHVAFSREVTNFLFILFITFTAFWLLPYMGKLLSTRVYYYLDEFPDINLNNSGDLMRVCAKAMLDTLVVLSLPLALNFLATFIGAFVQNGIIYSPESIMPNLEKINPLSGFKKIFSKKSVVDLIKNLVKITLIGFTGYLIFKFNTNEIINSTAESFETGLWLFLHLLAKILLAICMVMAVIAALDYFYERYTYIESLKMTKQELKEEFKQTEGNQEIKAKQRRIAIERLRRQMIARVPKATIVITNPTHYAIALQYVKDEMLAPLVIAKGVDHVALSIREIAKKHDIPIYENPPLARALYDAAEVDNYIPYDFYKAVAEVLGEVMQKKQRKKGSIN